MDGLAIAAALTEINRVVTNASIRTVYQPDRWTLVIHLFAGRELRLLISPQQARIHLTNLDLPHPQTPSPFTMLLRKHLRGGRITAVNQDGWERVVRLEITRRGPDGDVSLTLIAELIGVRGNLVLVREGRVIAALRPGSRIQLGGVYRPLPRQGKLDPQKVDPQVISKVLTADDPVRRLVKEIDGIGKNTAQVIATREENGPEEIVSRITEIISYIDRPVGCYDENEKAAYFFPVESGEVLPSFSMALDQEYDDGRIGDLLDREENNLRFRFERALAKRKRTLAKLVRWLNEAEQEDALRHHADLIMIHLTELSRGMTQAELLDVESGSPVEVMLDPRLGPVENAQALYERAKRLRRGRPRVEARKRRLEKEIAVLEEGLNALAAGDVPSEEALSLLPTAPQMSEKRVVPTATRVYRIGGYRVEVGRNAIQNDALLRRAKPDDLWFHVKGLPGAHVIVHRCGKEEVPQNVIEAAARLAAGFSKGKGEARVEVSYTQAKYVRKPKGAPPGLVILDREKTIAVAPERHSG